MLAPTAAGTGSDVLLLSIVTTGTLEKQGVSAPPLLQDCAILDAELTVGLPTIATGIDAIVHAIEAFTSKIKKNRVSDCLTGETLGLLGANIRTARLQPNDRDARGAMLLGSMLAGMSFANAPVGAMHALAHPLGGHFHILHGLSNAIVLPYVMEFNAPAASDLYAEIALIISPLLDDKTDDAKVTAMIEAFKVLDPGLGMDPKLSSAGGNHNHLPMPAEDAMKQTRLLVNNLRDLTLGAACHIYAQAL